MSVENVTELTVRVWYTDFPDVKCDDLGLSFLAWQTQINIKIKCLTHAISSFATSKCRKLKDIKKSTVFHIYTPVWITWVGKTDFARFHMSSFSFLGICSYIKSKTTDLLIVDTYLQSVLLLPNIIMDKLKSAGKTT